MQVYITLLTTQKKAINFGLICIANFLLTSLKNIANAQISAMYILK